MDRLAPEARSRLMLRIRSEGTGPELVVRSVLSGTGGAGAEFRRNDRSLPGSPDFSFPSRMKALFVHGCFWHSCRCRKGRTPKSNAAYWAEKFRRNKERDRRAAAAIRRMGWAVLVIWEHETKDVEGLRRRIVAFLSS